MHVSQYTIRHNLIRNYRESALFTFLLSLSGISFLGIGATLWGLLAGLIHIQLTKTNRDANKIKGAAKLLDKAGHAFTARSEKS